VTCGRDLEESCDMKGSWGDKEYTALEIAREKQKKKSGGAAGWIPGRP